MDDWANLEEKLDQVITEVMFESPKQGSPTFGVLLGMLRSGMGVPSIAVAEAQQILEIGETPLPAMTQDQLRVLSDELVGLLRFACRRGSDGPVLTLIEGGA
jgi:hypothetical protein